MPDTAGYLVIGACAAVVTFVTTPVVARLSRTRGWMAAPDTRRVHLAPTPEVGVSLGACRCGLALLVGAPQQQAKGAEQGGAIKGLAQGGHAAAFWPQPQSACRW